MEYKCTFWNLQRFFDKRGLVVARSLGSSNQDWDEDRYNRKLGNVAGCLKRIHAVRPPALIGFCEIETNTILDDLRSRLGWEKMVSADDHIETHGLQGLDVALLFDSTIFETRAKIIQSISLNNSLSVRDILRVRLALRGGEGEIEVIIAHWPSRVISEGQILRMAHGFYLRRMIEQILKYSKADITRSNGRMELPNHSSLLRRWHTPCIVMGDFNDEPYDDSVRQALNSTRFMDYVQTAGVIKGKTLEDPDNYLSKRAPLYNPCWQLKFGSDESVVGTYYREGEWRTYDQVLVTHGAVNSQSRLTLVPDSVRSYRLDDFNENGLPVRMQTARIGAPNSFSPGNPVGVSDHFPVGFSIAIQ